MRILEIKESRAIIEVEKTELDNIVNNYLELQYYVGYEDGYNDWKKATEDADVDDDDTQKE